MKFDQFCKNLESKIEAAYNEGVTMPEAEKLAAEFLHAQLIVSSELKKADLDARMRKSGVKAIRAALYLESIKGQDKKPTEAALSAMLDSNELVQGEQDGHDKAEADRASLERYYDIFTNAHIYFRGVARGAFGG